MSIKFSKISRFLMIASLMLFAAFLAGCSGDDGKNGQDADLGVIEDIQDQLDALKEVGPESCSICHGGFGYDEHQAVYDDYADASAFAATVDDVTSVDNGDGTFTSTMTFTIIKDDEAYIDASLSGTDQKTYRAVTYDSATRKFNTGFSYSSPTSLGGGQYYVTSATASFAPEVSNSLVYMYVADEPLDTEGMTLYNDVASAGVAYGTLGTYVSVANVSGCEKCHGTPYMKHGYRAPEVDGLPDFASCKVCHIDTANGSHPDWQLLVNDPARYAALNAEAAANVGVDSTKDSIRELMTAAELAMYQYNRSIMNDVHMAHAMEFPYPQSMANCATCHEGKLDDVLTDANFVVETCKSCHPVTGNFQADSEDPGDCVAGDNFDPSDCVWDTTEFALETITPDDHEFDDGSVCNDCHNAGGTGPIFSAIHTGYNEMISDNTGIKYADAITASIDTATFDGADLTITISAAGTAGGLNAEDIVPAVNVSFYGWDTKDFIVSSHTRDANSLRMEKTFGTDNALFTEVDTGVAGTWGLILHVSAFAADPSITDLIADGTIKRAEIAVLPTLKNVDGDTIGLNAPSKTFDLNANAFENNYFSGTNAIVDVTKCNACHDQLATSFHSGNRGGNIVVCRTCHVVTSGGSHLEMQSRSIDSYVHAIHSFQAFDPGDIDFSEPVASLEYAHHIEHVFPNFTIKNCESCHNAGTYEVPDQAKSMPSLASAADTFTKDRNIGAVPAYVTGPASRACGSCHRSHMINEDKAGELAAFNQHTKTFGYLVEDNDGVLDSIINTIMSMFE